MKGENCHLPWEEVSEFEDDEFYGFCGDFEQNGQKSGLIWKKELKMKNM